MVEMVLMMIMAVSLAGMVLASANDPLSRKFWEDING